MKSFLKLLLLAALLLPYSLFAQQPEMADALHANGKIFVVVAVVVTILLGLIVYLVMIDRKVRELEERMKKK